jgi:hypothetical protein
LDGIARSRLGSIFPKFVGFSLDSDESQASQTPLFSTRASRSIPDPEYLVALLSPLEKQATQDEKDRQAIEGKFGQAKRRFNLDRVMAKLDNTSKTAIAITFLVKTALFA